jgi:hypothetical protein
VRRLLGQFTADHIERLGTRVRVHCRGAALRPTRLVDAQEIFLRGNPRDRADLRYLCCSSRIFSGTAQSEQPRLSTEMARGAKYTEIVKANTPPVQDPDLIQPGRALCLPPLS